MSDHRETLTALNAGSAQEQLVGAVQQALDEVGEPEHAWSQAEAALHELARPEHRGALLAWLVAAVGAGPVVRALADAVSPGNLVAAMVDAGALVHVGTWDPAGGFTGHQADEEWPVDAVPLYRAAEGEEANRG